MIYPVIMAGGIGTRFWPASSPQQPKQFLPLVGDKRSMLQLAVDRYSKFLDPKNIRIVSHQDYLPLLKKQMKGMRRSQWYLEPMMRNTAPCIGWAALTLLKKDPNAVMVVSPADPWIIGEKKFQRDIKSAIQFLKKHPKALVTFGAKPDSPETGYGYIEKGEDQKISPVKRFIEKPSLARAKRLIRNPKFLWNTGHFVWRADTILEEIERHLPKVYRGLFRLKAGALSSVYRRFEKISIDYGVLEKSHNVFVREASFGWTDLGSWKTVFEFRKSRAKKWISLDSKNCFVEAEGRNIATIGVSDLIIIDHPNGLLICHTKDTQRVKEISKYL